MNYYFLLFQFFTVEIWKDIPGYDNKYQVSSFGRLRNKKTLLIRRRKLKDGYFQTVINRKDVRVHRLVGLVFIENPDNKPFINHITGIRDYNYWWALEWCTHLENMRHENVNYKRKLHPHARRMGMYTLEGILISEYTSLLGAARSLGLSKSGIYCVAVGKRKTCGGYVWKYI